MTHREEASDKNPVRIYDVRTLERNLRRGLLSKKDYEKFLKSLPDRSDNAAPVRPEEGGDDDSPAD